MTEATSTRGPARGEALAAFCRALAGATEDVKWGDDLVFSVGGKMFACFHLPSFEPISFKVEPASFEAWVQHEGVRPAPYLARHGWVSVQSAATLPEPAFEDLLGSSHALVAAKLTARSREKLGLRDPIG